MLAHKPNFSRQKQNSRCKRTVVSQWQLAGNKSECKKSGNRRCVLFVKVKHQTKPKWFELNVFHCCLHSFTVLPGTTFYTSAFKKSQSTQPPRPKPQLTRLPCHCKTHLNNGFIGLSDFLNSKTKLPLVVVVGIFRAEPTVPVTRFLLWKRVELAHSRETTSVQHKGQTTSPCQFKTGFSTLCGKQTEFW